VTGARLLVDTHVLLWMLAEPERLGTHRAVVEDDRTEVLVSAASSWEIAIKHAIGRLPLPEPPERFLPGRLRALDATAVPVEHNHALATASLPPVHRDPFDRLLVAQARALGVPILTADRVLTRYPVDVLLVA
jgi:PIN domain nuclease of toxin-antitoxin system